MEQTNKGLSGNQLKLFAMLAMTVDHFTSVIWPDYPRDWWILLLHIMIEKVMAISCPET